MTDHDATIAALRAEHDALEAERLRLDAEHLAPVRAKIKAAFTAIERAETARAKAISDDDLRDPAAFEAVAAAAWHSNKAASRIHAFMRSICPQISAIDGWVNDGLGHLTPIPQISAADINDPDSIVNSPTELAATLPDLLALIPWRDKHGNRTDAATVAVSYPDLGLGGRTEITTDVGTGRYVLTTLRYGVKRTETSGDLPTVITFICNQTRSILHSREGY